MTKSRVWTAVDFEKDGFQFDYLHIPHSTSLSAYGGIPIPIACVRQGNGPTVLLTAGNHGDEYEGQIALLKLLHQLRDSELAGISGRIVILPSLNYPAVAAGDRVSPIDGGNLNRVFPGAANGTPTEMLAHYIVQALFPLSAIVIDLHSGGRSLAYHPLAYAQLGGDESYTTRAKELLSAFNAPVSVLTDGGSGGGATTLYAAAAASGIPALTAELGGGATLAPFGLDIATQGIRRVLNHYGVLPFDEYTEPKKTRLMKSPGHAGAVYAKDSGLFQPFVKEGQEVRKGELAGLLYSFEHPLASPQEIAVPMSGLVSCLRFPTHTSRGDCLINILVEM